MSEEKKYGLWEYMSEQHGLTLLESEVHEIISVARKEMELLDDEEINREYPIKGLVLTEDGKFVGSATMEMWHNSLRQEGARWALAKVRNPYPKTIQFIRDDEDGVMPINEVSYREGFSDGYNKGREAYLRLRNELKKKI